MAHKTTAAQAIAGSNLAPNRPGGGFNARGKIQFSKFAHIRHPPLGPPKGQLPPFFGANTVLITPVNYGRLFSRFSATGAFSVGAGLATGLSLDVDTGIITGTPTTQVLTTVTLTVTDDFGSSIDFDFDHTIVV